MPSLYVCYRWLFLKERMQACQTLTAGDVCASPVEFMHEHTDDCKRLQEAVNHAYKSKSKTFQQTSTCSLWLSCCVEQRCLDVVSSKLRITQLLMLVKRVNSLISVWRDRTHLPALTCFSCRAAAAQHHQQVHLSDHKCLRPSNLFQHNMLSNHLHLHLL